MSSSMSLKVMFVWRLFADEKLTVAEANLFLDKVAQQSRAICLTWALLILIQTQRKPFCVTVKCKTTEYDRTTMQCSNSWPNTSQIM